jgi:hypothetical protein
MNVSHFRTVLLVAAVAVPAMLLAQGVRQQRVSFKAGSSSADLTGTLKGNDTIDYVLRASEGQSMHVLFKSKSGAASFDVLPPGSDAAIAIGETVGNEWTGTLPATGDYRVRVFQQRNAARRGASATYSLSIGVTGRPDALVKGTPYHATGLVPCSVGPDPQGSANCSFGVIRGEAGRAEVHLAAPGFDVKLHKGDLRILRFNGKTVTSANPKEKVTATRESDSWLIGVNDFYFYTIPDAVIVGG